MKYHVEAYGCTLNQGETEMFTETLKQEGHTRVDSLEEADICVIGTCVVIRKTEERMKRRIKELNKKCSKLIVTGCLTKTDQKAIKNICPDAKVVFPEDIETREATEENNIGILPVSSGCFGDCSYCITKLARGDLCSREPEVLLKRFKSLLSSGAREIQLTSEDNAIYGLDIDTSLPSLLEKLTSIQGDYRIRVGMMNPNTTERILDDVIDKMTHPNIYKFLHLPLQSGSDEVLDKMGRKYTIEEWKDVVGAFRDQFPDMTLSTDIIAGFPGETNEDFEKSKEVIEEIKPDIVNVTRFSPRPGTSAAEMENKVGSREKKRRSKEMSSLRLKLSREINERYVGREESILVLEEGKNQTLKGRMDNYKVVVLKEFCPELIGQRVDVRIVDSEDVYLVGELK